jgi:hypothetical protein
MLVGVANQCPQVSFVEWYRDRIGHDLERAGIDGIHSARDRIGVQPATELAP